MKGWRLPSIPELASLIDLSLPAPFVPGTVFSGVQSAGYLSATTQADIPNNARVVFFDDGNVRALLKTDNLALVWCVRGGMNADQY